MQPLIYFLSFLVTVLAVFLAWHSAKDENRSVKSASITVAVVAPLISMLLYWSSEKGARMQSLEGRLVPPENAVKEIHSLAWEFGDPKRPSVLHFTEASLDLQSLISSIPIKLEKDHGGKLLVTCRVYDKSGNLVTEITRNQWKISPPPNTFDRNYNDHSVEVRDSSGDIMLQATLFEDRVRVQGRFHTRDGKYLAIGEGDGGGLMAFSKEQDKGIRITPLFKYPSNAHFGELAGGEKD